MNVTVKVVLKDLRTDKDLWIYAEERNIEQGDTVQLTVPAHPTPGGFLVPIQFSDT